MVFADFAPEIKVLLYCSRLNFDDETLNSVRSLAKVVAWQRFLDLCYDHDVYPIVYKNLSLHCPGVVPGWVINRLKNSFYRNLTENLYLVDELFRMLDIFNDEHIVLLPFKGPVLAQRLYGDIGFRRFVDLDVWVRKDDVFQIAEKFFKLGYHYKKKPVRKPGTKFFRLEYHLPMIHDRNRFFLKYTGKFWLTFSISNMTMTESGSGRSGSF